MEVQEWWEYTQDRKESFEENNNSVLNLKLFLLGTVFRIRFGFSERIACLLLLRVSFSVMCYPVAKLGKDSAGKQNKYSDNI